MPWPRTGERGIFTRGSVNSQFNAYICRHTVPCQLATSDRDPGREDGCHRKDRLRRRHSLALSGSSAPSGLVHGREGGAGGSKGLRGNERAPLGAHPPGFLPPGGTRGHPWGLTLPGPFPTRPCVHRGGCPGDRAPPSRRGTIRTGGGGRSPNTGRDASSDLIILTLAASRPGFLSEPTFRGVMSAIRAMSMREGSFSTCFARVRRVPGRPGAPMHPYQTGEGFSCRTPSANGTAAAKTAFGSRPW